MHEIKVMRFRCGHCLTLHETRLAAQKCCICQTPKCGQARVYTMMDGKRCSLCRKCGAIAMLPSLLKRLEQLNKDIAYTRSIAESGKMLLPKVFGATSEKSKPAKLRKSKR